MPLQKKTLDTDFDVVAVINKTYQDSTEYDLNDALIYLGNVISKTKIKNKELVKTNFSKFVECRIVLEEILDDMKRKGLDKDMALDVKENIANLNSKFKNLTKNILTSTNFDDNHEQRTLIEKKYSTLFNLESLLKSNLNHKERFVRIYEEGYGQYKELKESKFIQKIWQNVLEVRRNFLEEVYEEIQNEENSFTEVLYFFDLYFKVAEDKTDRKIMNTLLLNFKRKVIDVPYVEKGYFLKEVNYFFLRTIIHLEKDLQRELIKTLFKKVEEVFRISSLPFIRIWSMKYKNLINQMNIPLEVVSAYNTTLKMLKKEVINKRIEVKTSMERLTSTFKLYDEMLDKDEKYLLYNRFLAIIKEKIEQMDMSSYTKVDNFVKQLGYFDKFLKGSADLFDEFEEMKKNVVNRELKKEIMSLAKFIQTTESKPCVLMEIVRIIDRAPTNFKKIISGASASFEKDKVLVKRLLSPLNGRLNLVDLFILFIILHRSIPSQGI